MATLDSYLVHLSSQDTKKKLAVGNDILNYLSTEDNTLECENISAFIDSIIHWLNNSNFKVFLNHLLLFIILCICFCRSARFILCSRGTIYVMLTLCFSLLLGCSKWPRNTCSTDISHEGRPKAVLIIKYADNAPVKCILN